MTRRNAHTYQVGIASYSLDKDCGIDSKAPSIFDRVTTHIQWIQEHTQGAQWCHAPYQAIL